MNRILTAFILFRKVNKISLAMWRSYFSFFQDEKTAKNELFKDFSTKKKWYGVALTEAKENNYQRGKRTSQMVRVILLSFLVCIGLSSCSFHWHITPHDVKKHDRIAADSSHYRMHAILPQPDYDTVVAAVPNTDTSLALKKLISQLTPLWDAHFDYKTFSGKAKIHFSGPDNDKTFTAHFRLRKDSVIWVNVTFDAINVARLFITRDSFFLLNMIDQEVTRIPLSQAAKVLPTKVDFSSLQNLVTGESLQKGTITNAASSPDSWTIQVEDSNYIQHIVFNKKDSTMRGGQLRTRDLKGPQAITGYENYEMVDGRKISTFRTLNVQKGPDTYILEMNFSKVGFDEELDYPFSIPKNYTEKK